MAEYNDVVYVIYSETDYNTNTSNHTLYSYNAKTNKKKKLVFYKCQKNSRLVSLYVEYQS